MSFPCPLALALASAKSTEIEKANMAIIFDKYKDKIATLPMQKGWISGNLYKYQGFWYQSMRRISVEAVMAAQDTFQPHPTDIYLATLPKSGTTWLKALAFAIVTRAKYKHNLLAHPLLHTNPHDLLPYVETQVYETTPAAPIAQPRLFATHIPYSSLPGSVLDSGCRIVYMYRNPKDVLVSLFHFVNKLRDESLPPLPMKEAFELFCEGSMPNGPYWDHVVGYGQAAVQHPTRIWCVSYEDMKKDTLGNVMRLAEFLGFPFTGEEEEEEAQEIVKLCSFGKLSEVNKNGNWREGIPNESFFREGIVGDWSNHLTPEMSHVLDKISLHKFHGLDISF